MQFEIEQEKEKLINILSTQYSHNLIAIDEYERLLDFVNKTETNKEIEYIRKIIDTNETYSLKATHPTDLNKTENKPPLKKPQGYTMPVVFKNRLSRKRDVKTIKIIGGTYELRLHDIDFPNNWLTLKLKIISGEMIIYIPYNVSVENNVCFYGGDTFMNKPVNVNNDEVKNKLVIAGTVMGGNLYIVYEK
ncbi:MAG: hypothetical protein LBO67_07800 [Spirochaetaceae bacterium]|jgi:hypothetical protein|nr:hypothetical protein [Spirochaetaceae bacterium]